MDRLANRDAASRVATGKAAAKRGAGRRRPVRNEYPAQDDPHDAIDLEFLRIWMRISRLREKIHDDRHVVNPRKSPMNKAPRRKAA
jgi:hypothetical protein